MNMLMRTCLLLVLGGLPVLGGCRMPAVALGLVDGLERSIDNAAAGQSLLGEAMAAQLDAQQAALDAAFESDIRRLADAGDAVALDDVLEAKRFYDARRGEIDASRANVKKANARVADNLDAARRLADMLRQLIRQQNVLAGEIDLTAGAILGQTNND